MTDFSAELGHVQLEVADLEQSAAFYARFLGLSVSERMESRKGQMVLLSGGERHTEVTLRAAPDGGDAGGDGDGGRNGVGTSGGAATAFSAPFQVAFEVPDRGAFADLFFELRKAGIPTTAVDHGVSWAVYFRDPDGNALEAYWDTREVEGGRPRWEGRSRLLGVRQVLSEERIRELAERAEEEDGPPPGERPDREEASGDGAPVREEASGDGAPVREEASGDGEPQREAAPAKEAGPEGDEGGDARRRR